MGDSRTEDRRRSPGGASTPTPLGDRIASIRMRTLFLFGAIGLAVVVVLVVLAFLMRDPDPGPAAAPPPPAVDTETTQPGVPADVQVPDGPAPDVGPFGIDG